MAMTIKPKLTRAFLKEFVIYFILISIITFAVPFQSESAGVGENFWFAIFGGLFFGAFIAFFFTPVEITWDEDTFTIRAIFRDPVEHRWSELEAYSPFARGPFLIKFVGKKTFQIYPAGFRSVEWKTFQRFLRQRFPRKKAWVWLGPLPLCFGNRKI